MKSSSVNHYNITSPLMEFDEEASEDTPLLFEFTSLPSKSATRKRMLQAVGSILGLGICTVLERLCFKLMVDRMESYRYFIAQFVTFLYIPPMFLTVGYKATTSTDVSSYDEETLSEFPKSRFFIMALLDMISTMMLFISGGDTPAPLTVILLQMTIPATAVMTRIYWNSTYDRTQIIGAVLITLGCIVSLFPSIISKDGASTVLYVLAVVPMSASMLYKERAIRNQPMDIFYLNAWVSTYQFLLGIIVVAPLIFDLNVFDLHQRIDGLECLVFGNQRSSVDNCQYGMWIVLGYVATSSAVNGFVLQVMKYGTVSIMYKTVAAAFPLSWSLLEFYQHSSTTIESLVINFVSTVVVLVGVLLYRSKEEPDSTALTMSVEEMERLADEEGT